MALQQIRLFNNIKVLKGSKLLGTITSFSEVRTRKLTALSFTLLALIIFGIFAINPTLSTIARLRRELTDKRFVDEKLKEKINSLSVLHGKYAEIQPDIPIVLAAIPKTPEAPTLVGIIQTIGDSANITISGIQVFQVEAVSVQSARKESSAFSFSVTCRGSYQDLVRFMESLTSSQRIITIDNISISKKGGADELLHLTLRGTTYFKD